MKNGTLAHLSDAALTSEVRLLARTEHDTTVALVMHLAEFGARQLYLAAGFSSLFVYCREVLALSEGEAYNRTVAARAVGRFPVALDRLAEGSVNLTTIRLLEKHLTAENHLELLDASTGQSKRDVEQLIAARFPQPAVPFSVRKVPKPAAPARAEASPLTLAHVETSLPLAPTGEIESAPTALAAADRAPAPSTPKRPATISPIAEDQYSVRFTASGTTWEKLQAAQDLLRHALPSGDVSLIFDRALTLLLEDLARKKFGATTRPRVGKGTKPGSRDIPHAIQRAVWVRDCARCAFVSTSGRRCPERGRVNSGRDLSKSSPYTRLIIVRTPSAGLIAAGGFVAAMAALPIILGPSGIGHSRRAIEAFDRSLREPTPDSKVAWQREGLRIRVIGTAFESGVFALGATLLIGVVRVIRRRTPLVSFTPPL